ncbi:YesL family protein [Amphibacillus sp. Q70]|uniref:YesL family protein n=1 Tax=Amphibacillus sp. Q70 TaxID=3453416 RepID=UPI003F86CE31
MQDYSSVMHSLYSLTEWLMRFVIVNFIWFIINIPVGLVLVNTIMVDAGRIMHVLPLIILVPLLFFPSTMAMFATVRAWVIKKEIQSLIKTYFHYLKENYFKSLISGFIWIIIWLVWLIDFIYFSKESNVMALIMLIIGMMLIVFNVNYFSISVHYYMKMKDRFKNSLLITIGSPLSFCSILLTLFILLFLATSSFLFLLPLLIGSVSAFISFLSFYRFSLKIKPDTKSSQ